MAGLPWAVDAVVELLGREERETALDPSPPDRLVPSSSEFTRSRARFERDSPVDVRLTVRLVAECELEEVDPLARIPSLFLLSGAAARFLDPPGIALFVYPVRSGIVAVLLDLDE